MNVQEDAFTKNFTVILVVAICGIAGLAAFEQFAEKKVISAEESAANTKPIGQINALAPAEIAPAVLAPTAAPEQAAAPSNKPAEPAPVAAAPAAPTPPVETAQESTNTPAQADNAANSATTVATASEDAPTESDAEIANGEKVYKSACFICHDSGVSGAPKLGNKDEWTPRIAQGIDMMVKHATEGFTGTKGMMPAKGGRMELPDKDVKSAVSYMVSKTK